MLRKLFRGFVFVILGLAVAGGILYTAGLRIVFYGGGDIGFAFLKSANEQATEIELALVRADPTSHQETARFAAIDGKTWNHPAMNDGILLIRNIEEMAAFDLRK